MAHVDAHNSAIAGALPQNRKNLSEMRPNRHVEFQADR